MVSPIPHCTRFRCVVFGEKLARLKTDGKTGRRTGRINLKMAASKGLIALIALACLDVSFGQLPGEGKTLIPF